jgi:hypothetical protein
MEAVELNWKGAGARGSVGFQSTLYVRLGHRRRVTSCLFKYLPRRQRDEKLACSIEIPSAKYLMMKSRTSCSVGAGQLVIWNDDKMHDRGIGISRIDQTPRSQVNSFIILHTMRAPLWRPDPTSTLDVLKYLLMTSSISKFISRSYQYFTI